ncbi:acyltransferase [Leuconostocaceae bacterium ESL0958]|nr:acyltransferase [Leuconostocaceae bacterium ESL0958]
MKRRYAYMDILNVMATLAVVILHGSSYAFSNRGGHIWTLAVAVQVLFIWAVPVFFMLSGANNLDYRQRMDSWSFFKRRLQRVLLPFLSWSIIWFLYYRQQKGSLALNHWQTYGQFVDQLLHGSIQPIFWFFYVIIGFYLSAPVLSKIMTVTNKRTVQYLLLLGLVFGGLIGYYYDLQQQSPTAFIGGLSIGVSGSVIFFALGWYVKHFPLKAKQARFLYLAGALSAIIMIGLTIYLSQERGAYQRQVYSIWGIFGLTWSAAIFVFIQNHLLNWQPGAKLGKILRTVAASSQGVYVLHYFFYDYIDYHHLLSNHSLYYLLALPLLIWLLSMALVMVIQKIPYLRRIV